MALGIAFACAVAVCLPAAAQESRERTMYVSAVDQKGEPVEGLGQNDFVVREDGVQREVLRVTRATEPIDIAILVDDSAASESLIPRVREALRSFIAKMAMGNQIAIVGLADRPTILANYTSNTKLLQDAIGLLWPRTRAGTTLMDALFEVSRGLERRETPRAVIIPIITDGGDFPNRQYEQVMPEVKQAGAAIHAIAVGNFSSTDHDELRNRARILSEGTRTTGGQRVSLLSEISVQQALDRLARELSSQYKVVYSRPESLIPPDKLEVSARRPGITMRGAPERGTGTTK
ncbi:MAG TPA: VWA domain-containing protein [Vicinamibacterales bacterium]|nr:VWA domain-containing protein [Vicinamibacterales bacterium]